MSNNNKMKVGVIGSGRISEQYLNNMINYYKNLEVVAISSANIEHAKARAAQFGIKAMTTEELLSLKEIELVVVLVPTPVHAPLIKQALLAGKHVYTEKTMCENLADAAELIELANSKNLLLGSAPDTFMGDALQTARKALDDGLIGEPLSFSLNINRNIDFLAGLFDFLRLPGGGFAYDYGVYYLTALVSLLGPVKKLYSVVKNKAVERVNTAPMSPDFGKTYTYENESQIYALMNLENGITGTVSMNGDSNLMDIPFFYIYGTKGILKLSCANDFGGKIEYLPSPETWGPQEVIVLNSVSPITGERRGIGPAELALSIREKRRPMTDAQMAYHVLDVIETLMASSASSTPLEVKSTCARPCPLTPETLSKLV